MAKGKSVNPADAYRKAQRKKEIKKNKAERTKARDFALVKKDTGDLEEDIEKLEAASELSASDKAHLTELKSELERINKKKEEYVVEHPEQRKLVYRSRKQHGDKEEKAEEATAPKKRNMFNKHGLPRHPERSIYYDPVMNLWRCPPGMPYIERPLRPDEVASDEDHSGEDDDIMMPEGPPPGPENEEVVGSDDDIPMPEGPPPPKDGEPPLPPLSSPPPHPPFVPPAPQLPP
ncbi:Protein saf1 [Grifola frondosa]|uniref:Protein saf1 n=1 Tax=Grifola frondosa TaxID=5627 RepID=A0A1C7LUC1_GRIFR|nr:Protein saf1 [Grifola frondosa]